MNHRELKVSREVRSGLLLSVLMAGILLFAGWQTIQAQEPTSRPPILTESSKSVDKDSAQPGETLSYEIVVRNTGNDFVTDVSMTDTLPAELAYVPGSLAADSGVFGENNGIITWTGVLNANGDSVTLGFDAMLTDTLMADTVVTNSVVISADGAAITRAAATTIYTRTGGSNYLPMIQKSYPPPPQPSLSLAGRPTPENQWTLVWTIPDDQYVDHYEIVEADNPEFVDAQVLGTTQIKEFAVDKPLLSENALYYLVRAVGPGGVSPWSNILEVIASYRDDFSAEQDWFIRRQDDDDTDNKSYYADGHYVLEIDGRWDYAISSPLEPAPEPPYRIETRAYLNEPDNLNTYGIIFGGDWDGVTECPGTDYRGCLNHYYRLSIIWFGSPDHLKVQLKRIDRHDANNEGRGDTTLIEGTFPVNPPPKGYQNWAVEVYPNGTIKLFHDDELLGTASDATYVNDPFFGAFAASDEYLGAEPHYDWYEVVRLP